MLIHHPDAGTGTAEGNNQRRLQTWKAMEEFMNEGLLLLLLIFSYYYSYAYS
jgi:diketogulonate reductase-like aldo/keto reductase